MKRILLSLIIILCLFSSVSAGLIPITGFSGGSTMAPAQLNQVDSTPANWPFGNYIALSNGYTSIGYISYAFCNSATSKAWQSDHSGSGVIGVDYIGAQFNTAVAVAGFTVTGSVYNGSNYWFASGTNAVILQYSDTGSTWINAGTYSVGNYNSSLVVNTPNVGAHLYWRLMANANVVSTYYLSVQNLIFYVNESLFNIQYLQDRGRHRIELYPVGMGR